MWTEEDEAYYARAEADGASMRAGRALLGKRKVITYDLTNTGGVTRLCRRHGPPSGACQVSHGLHWGQCDECTRRAGALSAALIALRDETQALGWQGHKEVRELGEAKSVRHAAKLIAWVEAGCGVLPPPASLGAAKSALAAMGDDEEAADVELVSE